MGLIGCPKTLVQNYHSTLYKSQKSIDLKDIVSEYNMPLLDPYRLVLTLHISKSLCLILSYLFSMLLQLHKLCSVK